MKTGLITMLAAGLAFLAGWGAARSFHPTTAQPRETERPRAVRTVAEAEVREAAGAKVEALAREEEEARAGFIAHLKKGAAPADRDQFSEWAKTAPLAELEAVIEALGPAPEPVWAVHELMARLAARDPQAALRRFEAWTAFTRFQLLGTLVEGWSTEDPKAALAWLATQPTNAATDGARESALTHMAAADPRAALALMREHDWLWDSPQALRGIFRAWVKNDPKAALEQWRSLNRELNPPLSPEAEPPIAPHTMGLIAVVLSDAAESKKVETVEAALDLMEPRELARMDAVIWHRMVVRQNPQAFLPLLEARLTPKEMKSVVEITLHYAPPETTEAIVAVLKNPILKTAAQLSAPPSQTEWPATRDVMSKAGENPALGGDFWDTPIKIN